MYRRRMLMSVIKEPSELPSGYTRCEYINGTGTQWIDTMFVPTLNTEARVVFSPNRTNSYGFFGARKDPYRFNCTTFSDSKKIWIGCYE